MLGVVRGGRRAARAWSASTASPGRASSRSWSATTRWKYIFLANGGREQLFDPENDPCGAARTWSISSPTTASALRQTAARACDRPGAREALEGGKPARPSPYAERPRARIYQFDRSRGVTGFPARPRTRSGEEPSQEAKVVAVLVPARRFLVAHEVGEADVAHAEVMADVDIRSGSPSTRRRTRRRCRSAGRCGSAARRTGRSRRARGGLVRRATPGTDPCQNSSSAR